MSEENTYNGWTNYETWVVKLWMDNEQPSCEFWQHETRRIYLASAAHPSLNARLTGHEPFTQSERAVLTLAETLKASHEDALPELQGFAADLLNGAMSAVNWHEIARSLVEALESELKHEAARS